MQRALDPTRIVPALVALFVVVGCMDRELTGLDPVVQNVAVLNWTQPPSGKVDILVVVDNSGSMFQEQQALVNNFPQLIEELMAPSDPDHEPVADLNIGVISTDLGSAGYRLPTCGNGTLGFGGGDDGCFRSTPSPDVTGCAGAYPAFLHRGPDNAASYAVAQMGTDFGCIATLGTGGCGMEQQMEAARKALVEKTAGGGCNAGFLRDDSILAVLWVTDEEDCSVQDSAILDPDRNAEFGHPNIRCYFHPEMFQPVSGMIDQLRALRSNPRDFLLAMIVGVPVDSSCEGYGDDLGDCLGLLDMQYRLMPSGTDIEPACVNSSGWGIAYPGRRFVEAAQLMGDKAFIRSICADDWRPAMDGILELIQGALDNVCFAHELALDPATCQAECDVIEVLPGDGPCPAGRVEADPSTQLDAAGRTHRRCVIPQAERIPAADGTCGDPTSSGWFYTPAGPSDGGCNRVSFTADTVPLPSSETQLECLSYVCPAERRCGGASNPGGRCCAADEVCVDADPLAGGRCVSL